MRILWIAVIAAILDLLLGDPLWMPHVVRLLGTVIGGLDRYLRSLTDRLPEEADRKQMERLCGILLCILVLGSTWVVWTVLRAVLYRISTWLGFAAECFLAYQLLAMRCLRKESIKVYHALAAGDVELARHNLSMIVGRDTAVLSRKESSGRTWRRLRKICPTGWWHRCFSCFWEGRSPCCCTKR